MHPATGYRNISEWAKQQKCWEAIKLKKVDWDKEWLGELIDLDEEKDIQREGSRNQKTLNGIEAQTAVCEMGSGFWQNVLNWCLAEGEGTEKERGILQYACALPSKVPSESQSVVLINMMKRLHRAGCPYRVKSSQYRL